MSIYSCRECDINCCVAVKDEYTKPMKCPYYSPITKKPKYFKLGEVHA